MYEAGQKVFKIKKRIISGIECTDLDTMRFIVGRFTSFSPKLSFCPASSHTKYNYNYFLEKYIIFTLIT